MSEEMGMSNHDVCFSASLVTATLLTIVKVRCWVMGHLAGKIFHNHAITGGLDPSLMSLYVAHVQVCNS